MPSLTGALASLSMHAALAHTTGRFWLAYVWFIPHAGLCYLLPLFITAAVIFDVLSGIISHAMLKRLEV